MNTLSGILIAAALVLVLGGSSEAQPVVKEFNSIAELRANNQDPFSPTAPFSVHVAAYYCLSTAPCPPVAADGGEGLFVAGKTGCILARDDDGGSIIVDTLGTCWYRQNVNGDLRQFGATSGSGYDCSGSAIKTCAPADGTPNILLNAQTAAEKAGVHRLTTSGVQIYLANAFSLDSDMSLDGAVGSPDVSNHNINNPGTIWTTDTASATALTLGSGSVLRNAALMPHWIGQNLYNWGISADGVTYLDQQQILSHMIGTGQTGVSCVNQNCAIRNAVVAGYDTAVEASGQGTLLEDVSADGDACIYFHDSGSGTHWRNVTCSPLATRDGVSEEYFSITSVTDDGTSAHNCKLTLAPLSGSNPGDIDARYYAWVSGLDPNTGANANGRWKPASVSGNTVVLDKSQCNGSGTLNGPAVTASYTAGTQTIRLASGTNSDDIANIKTGQTVTGAGIPDNTVVRAVSVSTGCVPPATGACILVGISNPVTGTQSGASVTFSSSSFSGGDPNSCTIHHNQGSTGRCLMLTSQERVDVGGSGGGKAANGSGSGGAGCATAFLIGGFDSDAKPTYSCQTGSSANTTENTAGFDLLSPFCYAFAICYHLGNAYNTRLISAGMDATRNLNDDDTAFGIVDGSFKGVSFIGGKAGKVGSGLVINPSGTDKGCVTVSSQNLDILEADNGCLLGGGLDSAGTLIVSDNALAVQVSGYAPNLKIYKQDATPAHLASAVTDTSGALQVKSGSTWWGGQFTPGGAAPTLFNTGIGGATVATGNDTVGHFVVGAVTSGSPSLTFSHPWVNAPICRAWDVVTAASFPVNVTSLGITIGGTMTSGHTIAYQCIGYST